MTRATVEQLNAFLNEVPFARLLGVQVLDADEGVCRVRLPYRKQHLQYYRLIHGGVIASLADSVIYLAQATLNGITKNTVTIEMNVHFLTSAGEEDLYAEGRILKNGNKIIYGEVRVANAEETLIAHATVTYLRLDYDVRG